MIGFVGSVFSPYYAFARRRGPADPEAFVAINVALYGPGGRWAMTERGRPSLRRDRDRLVVGPSSMTIRGDTLDVAVDEISVPVPRRLRGGFRLTLPAAAPPAIPLDPDGLHHWQPIAPAARIEVAFDAPGLAWSGHGYMDHNRGDEPLEAGFSRWSWTRLTDPAGTVVAWDLVPRRGPPRAFTLAPAANGGLETHPAPRAIALPRTLWRVERPLITDRPAASGLVRTLEDTPFYARSEVRASLLGRPGHGVHETLSLDRFRSPVVQAMLPFRMPRRS